MDRGAWWATVRGVTKTWTHLKPRSAHTLLTKPSVARFLTDGDGQRPGSSLRPLCLAHSYVWRKDNVVIAPSSSSRVVVEKDGSLLISQTWSGDIGDYTCGVVSEGGNDSRTARLEVM